MIPKTEACPYKMLQEAYAANQALVQTCEQLIERLEARQEEYNQIVEYAKTLGRQAQKWKQKAEEADDRNRELINGLEFASNVIQRQIGVKNPLYLQLQSFLERAI